MVAARKAGLDLAAVLDVINSSSGVSYASTNRFPHIIKGDYLEGGLTSNLMTKDVVAYVDHVRELGVPCLNAAGPLAAFGAAANLGYGELISNRVVDAIGDLAGGVRLYDPETGHGRKTRSLTWTEGGMMAADTVGFIGLGNMGIPMSRRLVEAGYHVRGFDTAADARQSFEAIGSADAGGGVTALPSWARSATARTPSS